MDLKLIIIDPLTTPTWDLAIEDNDFSKVQGLETAVIISLFTDARVTDEERPLGEESKKGWWGDGVSNPAGTSLGSKLWLLDREKILDETLERARQYCLEALQWLLDDSIAEDLTVETSYISNSTMRIDISILRPQGDEVNFFFNYLWTGQISEVS